MLRRTPLRRGTSQLKRTPLKKSGTTKAKKVARQRAFYASREWKLIRSDALDRANHRCEYIERWGFPFVPVEIGKRYIRCQVTTQLQVHHKTNVRFGGDELPEDLQVLCCAHHQEIESRIRPWNKS
jgi:hypothetical protein